MTLPDMGAGAANKMTIPGLNHVVASTGPPSLALPCLVWVGANALHVFYVLTGALFPFLTSSCTLYTKRCGGCCDEKCGNGR